MMNIALRKCNLRQRSPVGCGPDPASFLRRALRLASNLTSIFYESIMCFGILLSPQHVNQIIGFELMAFAVITSSKSPSIKACELHSVTTWRSYFPFLWWRRIKSFTTELCWSSVTCKMTLPISLLPITTHMFDLPDSQTDMCIESCCVKLPSPVWGVKKNTEMVEFSMMVKVH